MENESKIYNIIYDKEDITLEPKSGNYEKTVIFMHGLSGRPNECIELFLNETSPFPNNYKIVIPASGKLCMSGMQNFKMNSWYDFNIKGVPFLESINEAKKFIEPIIEKEINIFRNKLDENSVNKKIILSGYSQGCELAFYIGLTYEFPKIQKAIIGFNGSLMIDVPILLRDDEDLGEHDNRNIPMFAVHGAKDEIIEQEESEGSFKERKQIGRKNFKWVVLEESEHWPDEECCRCAREFIDSLDLVN